MSGTALILAAHGSGDDSEGNARLRNFADQIAHRRLFDEAAVAFHRGEPTFATVLDQLSADEVIVVPVMTSDGYYSDLVLPRELKKNHRYSVVRLHQTEPLGMHPGVTALVSLRVRSLIHDHHLCAEEVCVALVGHGTRRHERSRLATIKLAEALGKNEHCAEVLYAFLDEDPGVETILSRTTRPSIIVIPFLISGGSHSTIDIPTRLGLPPPALHGCVGDRFVVCDAAIGTHPEIVDVIIDLATADESNTISVAEIAS